VRQDESDSGARRPEPQRLGSVAAEVHRIRTQDSREIALTRVPPRSRPGAIAHHKQAGPGETAGATLQRARHREVAGDLGAAGGEAVTATTHATPVLLVHGNFSNRGFWISPRGIGLAPFLSERGYDAWIVELRGHGLSPKGPDFSSISAEDHIRHDLPAAVNHIAELTGKRIFLVGHSAGGIFVACFLAKPGAGRPERFLGAALFGAQMAGGEAYLKIPPLAFLSAALLRLLGRIPAPRLGLGPEDEPAGEMLEFIRWKKRGGKWQDSRGDSYAQGLKNVQTPVLAVAAARDKNDPAWGCRELLETFGSPDKRFVLLAQKEGFSTDYDHIGMIVSKEAGREVWPLLAEWMDQRKPR
jgi:pimeloyl-ACP methyl ester carboxylesterase